MSVRVITRVHVLPEQQARLQIGTLPQRFTRLPPKPVCLEIGSLLPGYERVMFCDSAPMSGDQINFPSVCTAVCCEDVSTLDLSAHGGIPPVNSFSRPASTSTTCLTVQPQIY